MAMSWWAGYAALWASVLYVSLPDILAFFRTFRPSPPTPQHAAGFVGYILLLAAFSAVLPGRRQRGALLADGKTRLRYRCNGLAVMCATVGLFGMLVRFGVVRGALIADAFAQLFIVGNALSLILSVYLWVTGRGSQSAGRQGFVSQFVMGTTLNPTLAGVDLKFFSYRPAMIGWLLINLSFACKQLDVLGTLTTRMLLYQSLTAFYVADYFVNEHKMVFTWDIIAENFGLMLVWADYVFIPFLFALQNFYLLSDTRPLSSVAATAIVATGAGGYAIFRGANTQKHRFKTDPKEPVWGRPPVVVGGRLLASGFWGVARHANYTGDLMLGLSYCLPCGRASPLAYFYIVYLTLLIVHREKRDDERCAKKYAEVWPDYCARVPYRLVPFVY